MVKDSDLSSSRQFRTIFNHRKSTSQLLELLSTYYEALVVEATYII